MLYECPICMEMNATVSLVCHKDHKLCIGCLSELSKTSDNCPICRDSSILVQRFIQPLPHKIQEENENENENSESVVVELYGLGLFRFDSFEDYSLWLYQNHVMICRIGCIDSKIKLRVENKKRKNSRRHNDTPRRNDTSRKNRTNFYR
jgi:hypothetical protein